MPALRPFQREDVDFLKKNNLKALIASAPGTGKTCVSIRALVESKGTFPALIVCPASVTRNWAKETAKWAKGIRTVIIEDMDSRIRLKPGPPTLFIISWSLLDARWVDLVRLRIMSVVADECFPPGTLVATEAGQIPIEFVQPGDKVWSYNKVTCQYELKHVTRHLTLPRTKPLVKIEHEQGSLIATEDHQIWTGERYGSAKTVSGSSLSLLPKDLCSTVVTDADLLGSLPPRFSRVESSSSSNDQPCLSSVLQKLSDSGRQEPAVLFPDLRVSEGGAASSDVRLEDMCLVFDNFPSGTKKSAAVLLQELFGEMENVSTGNQRNHEGLHSKVSSHADWDQATGCAISDVNQQPHEQTGVHRQDACENGWSHVPVARGKRSKDEAADCTGFSIGLGDGNCNTDCTCQRSVSESTSGLQSGCSERGTENCSGSRWSDTHVTEMEVPGQTKNQCLERSRVGRVEVYEQASGHSTGGGSELHPFVYDLEVEDNHNYFANRVLVSNCHYAKNPASLRSSALYKICKVAKHTLLLSGTPIVNNKSELAALNDLIGIENPPMIRRLLEDVAPDIPPKSRSYLHIKLRPEQQLEYERANEDFQNWLLERKAALIGEGLAKAEVDRILAAEGLAKIGYLRRLLGEFKVPACSDFIARAVRIGEPVVVFVEHQGALEKLSRSLAKQRIRHEIIDGAVGPKKRQELVEAFQRYEFPVFIGTRAAKEGITLTAARHLIFLERFFTSADEEQAEDRVRRIGQKLPTTIWFLHATNTVDDRVDQIVKSKRQLVRSAIGAATVEETPLSNVEELIANWQSRVDESGVEFVGLGLGDPLPPLPSPKNTHAITFHGSEWELQKALLWCKMNGYLPTSKSDLNGRFKLIVHPTDVFNKNQFRIFSVSKSIKVIHGERINKANERRVRNNLRGR